jgi:hypothetical protein
MSFHLNSPYFISPQLTSPHLTSSNLLAGNGTPQLLINANKTTGQTLHNLTYPILALQSLTYPSL